MKLSFDAEDESEIRHALEVLLAAYAELCSPGQVADHLHHLARELEKAQEKLDRGNPWGE